MTYLESQQALLRELGESRSAAELLSAWAALVAECQDGYDWDYSEYRNELRARDALGAVYDSPKLRSYAEHAEFQVELDKLDASFRALLADQELPGHEAWWRRAILRYAGEPYAEYMRDAYGIYVSSE